MILSFGNIAASIVSFLGDWYIPVNTVFGWIVLFLACFNVHRAVFFVLGFFCTRHFPPAKQYHKYAVLIPARNEATVIANLLQSIAKQDYPKEYLTVFVVADNCTDDTAAIARANGAVCYEHQNPNERTKGYGLKYLFEQIEKDYGIESFEGYFIFDADNLLNRDYISRMNDSFDAGEKIITSYRNSKNFDENWVAASYALHWIRSSRTRHRARSVLRLATNLQGTGFLFANELVKDGWKYVSLTEDRAFTADAVAHGYEISYNDAAVFYDEQPTSVRIAFRQRIRWSKGHLQAFVETGWYLFLNIFVGNVFRKREERKKMPVGKRIVEGVRHRFAAYDTLSQLIPGALIKAIGFVVVTFIFMSCHCYKVGTEIALFGGKDWISIVVRFLTGKELRVVIDPGMEAVLGNAMLSLFVFWLSRVQIDLANIFQGIYLFFTDRKRIKPMPLYKKVWYVLTWVTFDMFYRYSMYLALFMHVTWKQIPHTSTVTIEDLEESTQLSKEA